MMGHIENMVLFMTVGYLFCHWYTMVHTTVFNSLSLSLSPLSLSLSYFCYKLSGMECVKSCTIGNWNKLTEMRKYIEFDLNFDLTILTGMIRLNFRRIWI